MPKPESPTEPVSAEPETEGLGVSIRKRFAPFGPFELPLPPRELLSWTLEKPQSEDET